MKNRVNSFLLSVITLSVLLCGEALCAKFPYKYQLSLTSMFQNESKYLKEWLEFHILVGVEHFYLYDNLSTDNYLDVLKPYIESGIVELIDWPVKADNWMPIQGSANMDCIKRASKESKWLIIIDLDEYVVPVKDATITQLLSRYKKVGGLCANWVMYGTSFVKKIPENALLIETLLYRAVDNLPENYYVKSIVRPKHVISQYQLHTFFYKQGYSGVTSNGIPFSTSKSPVVILEDIRVNHYWCRDEDYFVNVKLPRRERLKDGNTTWKQHADTYYNVVKDETILRFVPELRKRLKK